MNVPFLRVLSVVTLLFHITCAAAFAEAPVAGGTAVKPVDLGKVDGVMTFEGRTGEGPMRDAWFAFTLQSAKRVEIAVDRRDVTVDLRVPGSQGVDGVLRSNAFSREPSIIHDVESGTYLLRTYADAPTDYAITITAN